MLAVGWRRFVMWRPSSAMRRWTTTATRSAGRITWVITMELPVRHFREKLAPHGHHRGREADRLRRRLADHRRREWALNFRFAQPGNIAEAYEPGNEGPLWWGTTATKSGGRGVTGMLDRCRQAIPARRSSNTPVRPRFGRAAAASGWLGTDRKDYIRCRERPQVLLREHSHGGGDGGFDPAHTRLLQHNRAWASRESNCPEEKRRRYRFHFRTGSSRTSRRRDSVYPRVSDRTMVPATKAINSRRSPALPMRPITSCRR